MAGEAANVRGPCSNCGAQLATDQRYCVECGHRVGPPLALPYALPAGVMAPPAAGRSGFTLPVPLQTVSTFAALALGFGFVVGTAISPNLGGIIAAPSPTVVAEAPPPDNSTTPATGGGGSGGGTSVAASTPAATVASTAPSSGGGGGDGGGGGGKKKKKKKKEQPLSFDGTVVRVNQVAQSYTISSNGGLIAIHTDSAPQVGEQVHAPVRKLKNGTYAEQGARSHSGTTDQANFLGTVTYCADLEQPSAPCDGSSDTDHYVYAVSSLGASVLVSASHPAQGAPPKVGSQVQVGVHIGANFQPVTPSSWSTDPSCTPPYDEEHGLPGSPAPTPELTQTAVSTTSTTTSALLETVVQTVCPAGTPRLVFSADDIREAGRDLTALPVPSSIDPSKLTPGEAIQADVAVANDGTLTLKGAASDQGTAGADDTTQGQGTLTGS
ncbi:MAG TPA: zinc ribbon domain-containing protein [Solirubrobacterales bacterium]|nr:zinc ribbon domain-containing protein [Solirubrobacterales bacterium]